MAVRRGDADAGADYGLSRSGGRGDFIKFLYGLATDANAFGRLFKSRVAYTIAAD